MITQAWRGLVDAIHDGEAIRDRLRVARPFFAGQARDDVVDIQQRWWATLGDGTWTAERADSTIKRHPAGRLMHLSGDLESVATSKAQIVDGRRTSSSDRGLSFRLQQRGRVFYAAFLDNDAVADPTQADALTVGEHFLDYVLARA